MRGNGRSHCPLTRCAVGLSLLVFSICLSATAASAALTGDDLLLIVNKTVPQGRELALFYAQVRNVPAGRIVEIDLPNADEITAADYAAGIAGPVKQFIAANQLGGKIKCLVTFYGVPLRVANRKPGANDQAETTALRGQLVEIEAAVKPIVRDFERLAAEINPALPAAAPGAGLGAASQRVEQVARFVQQKVATLPEAEKKVFAERFNALNLRLRSPLPGVPAAAGPVLNQGQIDALIARREDPLARADLRTFARRHAGLFGFAAVLNDQLNTLASIETDAAVDSELALLGWPNYPRTRWLTNPMNLRQRAANAPPMLMVARLDAPSPERVRSMIETGVRVEKAGLKGKVVIDGRGIPAHKPDGAVDPYGQFDQLLRNTATLLKSAPAIELVVDDRPPVFAPHSVKDVAVYCGWYSVGQYVPSFDFADGAVGYHVASFELLSMHAVNEKGWVPNLIKDGVVGTLGPVAEPYLHSFPRPDDFVPLLLSGKLTLAEIYWKTTPLVSWKQALIGDPLYTPFSVNPAITADRLLEPLRSAVR